MRGTPEPEPGAEFRSVSSKLSVFPATPGRRVRLRDFEQIQTRIFVGSSRIFSLLHQPLIYCLAQWDRDASGQDAPSRDLAGPLALSYLPTMVCNPTIRGSCLCFKKSFGFHALFFKS